MPYRSRKASRRQTAWSIGPTNGSGQARTTSGSTLITTGIVPTLEGLTIIRVRGLFHAFLTAAAAVGEGFHGAVGLCVVDTPAFVAGVTAVPLPITDSDDESWLWHSFFSLMTSTVTLVNGVGGNQWPMVIDSKAMRKWPDGKTICAVLEATELGTCTLNFVVNSRVLVKLP